VTAQLVPNASTEPTISVARAAAVLGIGLRSAYAAVERGEMPAIRVGRSVRIPTARFLARYELSQSEPVSAA
jgi:excisionase family DNA binding protein